MRDFCTIRRRTRIENDRTFLYFYYFVTYCYCRSCTTWYFIIKNKTYGECCIDYCRCTSNGTNTCHFSAYDSNFGVGKTPAIVALFIYVLLPILNNTVLGVQNIDKNIIEAGTSMGMTKLQLMKDVELPLALPLIISGIRLSSVYVISWATLASYIGAGGLGDLVFNGLNLYEPPMIISAAILVTCLALLIDFLLSLVEKWAVPKGLKVSR